MDIKKKMMMVRIGVNVTGLFILAIPIIFGIPLQNATSFFMAGAGLIMLGRVLIFLDVFGMGKSANGESDMVGKVSEEDRTRVADDSTVAIPENVYRN